MLLILGSLLIMSGFQIYLYPNVFCIILVIVSRIFFASRFIGSTTKLSISKKIEITAVVVYFFFFVVFDKGSGVWHLIMFTCTSLLAYLLMWYDDYAYLYSVEEERIK